MKINDPIYGNFTLEPVLTELIQTKPLQRLKNIYQGGASYLVNPAWNVTRFEHSLGVMLLIRKLGGSLEEQIAGLLHDISHTAFSHVIDFVLNHAEQDFHDQIFEEILLSSEIPSVLQQHGFSLASLLPIEKWSLLEQPLPLLCADRIDYTLRDLSTYNMISLEEASQFVGSLYVHDEKICVTSIEAAEWFVESYYKEVIDFFLNPLNVYGYATLTNILKVAINKKYIQLQDFLLDDAKLWEKITMIEDKKVKQMVQSLDKHAIESRDTYDIHQKKKIRIIDPLVFLEGAGVKKATELSDRVLEYNKKALKKSHEGTFVKVLH